MALKTTQAQLKKEFKGKIKEWQYAIFAKCFDCCGFQDDGYQDCEIYDCPLHKYRLRVPFGKTSRNLASYLRRSKAKIQRF